MVSVHKCLKIWDKIGKCLMGTAEKIEVYYKSMLPVL